MDPGEGRLCCVRAGARAEPQDSAFLQASAAFERLERGARSRQDSHLLETQIFLLRNAPALRICSPSPSAFSKYSSQAAVDVRGGWEAGWLLEGLRGDRLCLLARLAQLKQGLPLQPSCPSPSAGPAWSLCRFPGSANATEPYCNHINTTGDVGCAGAQTSWVDVLQVFTAVKTCRLCTPWEEGGGWFVSFQGSPGCSGRFSAEPLTARPCSAQQGAGALSIHLR